MSTEVNDANFIDNIIEYEHGRLEEEQTIRFFQYLVDTGKAWSLQGSYGDMAARLIAAGLVKENRDVP